MSQEALAAGILTYFVFLLSTTAHEAAHALAALIGGDSTAFRGGQVTLNPIPHIQREPFGMVVVPLLGLFLGGAMMGWASAPYDPLWQRRHPKRAAWMSLAGPAANFTLMLLAAALIHVGIWQGVLAAPDRVNLQHLVEAAQAGPWESVAKILSIFFGLNLLLGTFNLLPIPPLDGFGALPLLLTENGARRLYDMRQSLGSYAFLALLLGWKLFDVIFNPLFTFALRLLYPSLHYA